MKSPPLLIICGPTATGKTDLGIKLAPRFHGELLSADSRQVYSNMDVGTGKNISHYKLTKSKLSWQNKPLNYYQLSRTKIWGYDLVAPNQDFSIAHFQSFAHTIIPHLHTKSTLPIIVGGTGLYLKIFSVSLDTVSIKPDHALRQQLQSSSLSELQAHLHVVDPEKLKHMNHSDYHNPRRLVRAIEIAQHKEKSHTSSKSFSSSNQYWIGLTAPISHLEQRIADNVKSRAEQIEQEIQHLTTQFPQFWQLPSASTLGYSQYREYLDGRLSRSQAINLWIKAETQYLRRQLTWFKRLPQINWFDISLPSWNQQVEQTVDNWYSNPDTH